MEDIDVRVEYETKTNELNTETEYDFPDEELTVTELEVPDSSKLSVVGSFSKEKDKFANSNFYEDWKEEEEYKTLYEKLVPNKTFMDYIDVPIDHSVMDDLINQLEKYDHRYGVMTEEILTEKDLLQWLVDFRWRRHNLLDHHITFSEYAKITANVLGNIQVPSDFPVMITGNTILKQTPERIDKEPFYIDYTSTAIVTTNDTYEAHIKAELGEAKEQSINKLNLSVNWTDIDWLITNNKNYLTLTGVNEKKPKRTIRFKYRVDCVTGVQYVDEYMIIYILSSYAEHAIVFDKDFNVVEDTITHIFNDEIIRLMDPKTIIFRDRYQYYVNNDDGSFSTFPLVDMFDVNNNIVKAFTIVQTTLKDPRPISIVDRGPRINTKYGDQYQMIWSFNTSISLMTLYPAVGYTFDKYSFYNPRKYLTDADYNEACIPLHGGFRRVRMFPWFWGYPGITYSNGFWYGRYGRFWNMYWGFFW